MAIIDSRGRLHGRVGPVVYRTMGNIDIVQIRPGRVNQSLSTRESALEFGLASNSARFIRQALFPLVHTADGGMINRLNAAVLKCIKNSPDRERGERDLHDADLSFLEGFQFNRDSPLHEVLKVRPRAVLGTDDRVKVQVPAFTDPGGMQRPAHAHGCILRLMLVAISFRENYYEYHDYIDIDLGSGSRFDGQEWLPEKTVPPGSIVLLSASLHYYRAKGMLARPIELNSKTFSPAELLAAFKVPVTETPGAADRHEASAQERGGARRFSLGNYRGRELLKKTALLKEEQDEKKQKPPKEPETAFNNILMALPKGKIRFKKE